MLASTQQNAAIPAVPRNATSYAHRDMLFPYEFYDRVSSGTYPADSFSFLNGWIDAFTKNLNSRQWAIPDHEQVHGQGDLLAGQPAETVADQGGHEPDRLVLLFTTRKVYQRQHRDGVVVSAGPLDFIVS